MDFDQLAEIKRFAREKVKKGTGSQHGWDHIERVRNNALKIINLLKIKDIDLNLLEASCYLHDVPINRVNYYPLLNHWLEKLTIKRYLPEILGEFKIKENEKNILFNAVYSHPFSIPYKHLNRDKDIYTQVLQDADSIDYFSHEREKSYVNSINKIMIYRLGRFFSKKYLSYGRSHLGQYLNFPELDKFKWYENGY